MKMVNIGKHPDARETVKKETTIHRMLSNPYIIQYFGQRSEANIEYIFLEYASGGELFDRIEPDVGMPTPEARKYFRQLILAVEYLHSRGVAHRDLKPENLLLDAFDNLKVSDFGMATVYRLQGKERCLHKKCGTLPYVAPEVLERPYHAEPADIWSCGIILVALLAGELPWDQASIICPEYAAWRIGHIKCLTPWKKFQDSDLLFVQMILKHIPSERLSINDVKRNPWFSFEFNPENNKYSDQLRNDNKLYKMQKQTLCYSQPELPPVGINNLTCMKLNERTGLSFSQPIYVEDLLVSSQLQPINTQASQGSFQNLVRRMTRFFVTTNCQKTVKIITECLVRENYNYRINDIGTITITGIDKRKMPLVFKINIFDMDNKTLVDFRLSKGCGIEFKKEFIKVKVLVDDVILKIKNK
ncbi:serine/threonine-protein kinase grp isoform X2 [Phymastichus coffea]|nr:serine/threonine-protein kinase grp isoform X2 [Phymastichus coffea]XP_058800263.1 serine/threonine-protein kinase grp isoform X2 [Phymastichus coffea]